MISAAFGTTVTVDRPSDGNLEGRAVTQPGETKTVSDFITVQSFTNFSAMTGGFVAAWTAARQLGEFFEGRWFPFVLCLGFGLVSLITSKPGLDLSKLSSGILITLVNSLTLFGAVLAGASAVS